MMHINDHGVEHEHSAHNFSSNCKKESNATCLVVDIHVHREEEYNSYYSLVSLLITHCANRHIFNPPCLDRCLLSFQAFHVLPQ